MNENWKQILIPRTLISLTCKGENPFTSKQGYTGEVADDHFIFEMVVNGYEHFSNISDPPITKPYTIYFRDIIKV